MTTLAEYAADPNLAPLFEHVTELTVNAIPVELRGSDEDSWFSVKVVWRGENRYAVMHLNSAYNAQLQREWESLPSSRSDDFVENFRFPLLEAVQIAEKVAQQVTLQGLTVQDIIKHGGLDEAHAAIPWDQRPKKNARTANT